MMGLRFVPFSIAFIAGLAVAQAAPQKRGLNLAGDWNTGRGVFYVEQDGNRVHGGYDSRGKRDNKFEGTLEGGVLRFRWSQPSFPPEERSGTAEVRLTGNGTRWAGDWRDAAGAVAGKPGGFKGTKIGATPLEPERERAALKPSVVPLDDFVLPTPEGRKIRLSEFVRNKPLVLVSVVTAWCKNCNWEQPFVRKLYDRYGKRGFDVILVSHYAHPHDIGKFVERHRPPFPLVVATTSTDDGTRMGSDHYRFRTANGDLRKWGTPMNVFVKSGNLANPFVATGELIEADAISFIQKSLVSAKAATAR